MSPILRAGLLLPLLLAACTAIAWLALGTGWALALLAAGAAILIGWHLYQLDRLASWAAGPLDNAVPEGHGSWRVAFSAIYQRVRSRRSFQRDLSRTIERFRNAAEAMPDSIVVLDVKNRIRWANSRAQAQFGLDLAHDVGHPLLNLVREPEIVRYFDSADFSDPVVIGSQRHAGTTLSIQVFPFGVDEKLLISRDITQLEIMARMRRDFIANVSHEMKTPLTVISGFLETMQDVELDQRHRDRYLKLMRDQAKSMEHLVADLLTLSSLESEQSAAIDASFAIEPLVRELSDEAKALSGGQHTVVVSFGDDAAVVGSREELRSAFGNLVSNAIRYTPSGGTITLAWRRLDDAGAAFSVTDTGIGIAPEHHSRLTERFYRVDRSRSRATGGTGLGLAIVKHVVIRHQGELTIRSEPGRGSTFTARLPAQRIMWSSIPDSAPGLTLNVSAVEASESAAASTNT